MSFINFLDESNQSKVIDFKNRIKKCTKSDYDKIVKDLDTAFKDKTITSQEFDELDGELFKKIKSLQKVNENENQVSKEENIDETISNINSFNIDNVINKTFSSITQAHIWHLLIKSGQKHLALNELYINLQSDVDALSEKFIAQGGFLSEFGVNYTIITDEQTILSYVDLLRQDITYSLTEMKFNAELSSFYESLTSIQEHIDMFIYKFKLN
jgi:hypothetical protein